MFKELNKMFISYQLEMDQDVTLAILDEDNYRQTEEVLDGQLLSDKIDEIQGVNNCDYNGHFGSNVFYSVEREHDNPETHELVKNKIREYIKG